MDIRAKTPPARSLGHHRFTNMRADAQPISDYNVRTVMLATAIVVASLFGVGLAFHRAVSTGGAAFSCGPDVCDISIWEVPQ